MFSKKSLAVSLCGVIFLSNFQLLAHAVYVENPIVSSSKQSAFTSSSSSEISNKTEVTPKLTLPKKLKFLSNLHTAKGKNKLLNNQNGVPVDDNWWLGDISGNNAINGQNLINATLGQALKCDPVSCVLPSIPKTKIAIIDSGVDISAVQSQIPNVNFDTNNQVRYYTSLDDATCTSSNAYKPILMLDINGNVINSTTDFYCLNYAAQYDDQGHGTAVAGTIAQMYNQTILAPNISILPIAIHGNALDSIIIADAIRYAVNNGATIINISAGTPYQDPILQDAIDYAISSGVQIVASSGNCGVFTVSNCDWNNDGIQTPNVAEEMDNAPLYPASYRGVISVGASNYSASIDTITKSAYSNSSDNLSLVAPVGDGIPVVCGIVIPSNMILNSLKPNNNISPDCGYEAGTSFAAPQMAGAMALISQYIQIVNKLYDFGIAPKNQFMQGYAMFNENNSSMYLATSTTRLLDERYQIGNGLLNLFGAVSQINDQTQIFLEAIKNNLTSSSSSSSAVTNLPSNPATGGLLVIPAKNQNIQSSSKSNSSQPESLPNTIFKFLGIGGEKETVEILAQVSVGKGSTIRTGGSN
jgi:subtilisin family serine protease